MTPEQRQRLHRLADLGGLTTIAGLDAYPPDFLLGILVEVAAAVPRLSASRVDSLRHRARTRVAPGRQARLKAWSRALHLHRLDLTTAEVSHTIRRLGGSVPSEPAAAVAHLLTMIRFDASHDDVDMASTLGAWQRAGDARLWKAIVSPEQATRLDLRAHARALVAQMEQDLGTALEWVAIDHHDTDNPHVHLLIRGRDDRGRPLAIDPSYVQQGIRERSAELATRVLGLRTGHDILTSREHAAERVQFTELDRRLLAIAEGQRCVRYPSRTRHRRARAERTLEMRRLEFLTTLGLDERTGAGTWKLSADLERTLRQAQLAGDILKSRARHHAHVSDPTPSSGVCVADKG